MISDEAEADLRPNHPLAARMGLIAFLAHNVIVGSIFGTTGVLLKPMMERLGVSLELASIGAPMVIIGSAVLASVAGVLAARYSLRLLLAASGVSLALGWLLLALSDSYPLYLIAYGALLGPAMAIGGAVLPPTLVTRWFRRHRGLAIGLAHLSVVVAMMPVASNWLIARHGLEATFLVLAAFAVVVLLPASLLIVDFPPDEERPADAPAAAAAVPPGQGLSVGRLIGNGTFWALALAAAPTNTSSVLLGVHLVTMAETWGFDRASGAALASIMALVGIAGFVLFGWVSDRLGGALTLALIAFDEAVLWSLLLLGLPYEGTAVVIGLIGLHGAGTIPALAKAIGDRFDQATFSRAYGLASTVTLPLMILGVVGTASVVGLTGDYLAAIVAMIGFFVVVIPLGLLANRRPATLALA